MTDTLLQGRKLGTIHDPSPSSYQNMPPKGEALPAPIVDTNLTEEERLRIRAERAAAAEARLKKIGNDKKNKSTAGKRNNNSSPLRGPNSEPLMRWTAG